MDERRIVSRIVATARELRALDVDLAYVREVIPEVRQMQEQHKREQQEALERLNKLYSDGTRELDRRNGLLLSAIKDALVAYFNGNGMGVRKADNTGGLVEVFIGDKDGVDRVQSKVSCHVSLTFERQETAHFSLRNELLDDISEDLEEKQTVRKLLQAVKVADRKGFWTKGEKQAEDELR